MARVAACALSLLLASSLAEGVFKPAVAEGLHKLDALEAVLQKVVLASPNASPEQAKAAKKVVEDVEKAAAQISSNTTSQAEKAKTFQFAIKELTDLQKQWQVDAVVASNSTAIHEKMELLKKELAEKQAKLHQVEDMLKLDKLKKSLAEKQLELEGLTAAKAQARAREEAKKEDEAQHAMVKNVMAAAKEMTEPRKGLKVNALKTIPESLKPILSDMSARAHNVSAAIEKMDVDEKKREADMDKLPATSADLKKKQALVKMMKAQTRRTYKKARAVKEAELAELNEAVKGVQTGDIAVLTKVMAKMERETKAFDAKTNGVIY